MIWEEGILKITRGTTLGVESLRHQQVVPILCALSITLH